MLEHTLDQAILAPLAMQGIEDDVRFGLGQLLRQVPARINLDDVIASSPQPLGAGRAGDQGHIPFRRQSAEKNRNTLAHHIILSNTDRPWSGRDCL